RRPGGQVPAQRARLLGAARRQVVVVGGAERRLAVADQVQDAHPGTLIWGCSSTAHRGPAGIVAPSASSVGGASESSSTAAQRRSSLCSSRIFMTEVI